MNRHSFFKLLEAHDVGIAWERAKHASGQARAHGAGAVGGMVAGAKRLKRSFMANPDLRKTLAKGAGVAAAGIGGGLAFMRHRAGKVAASKAEHAAGVAKAAHEAAEAAKPMSRLKAAGSKLAGMAKGNPKAAIAAGAAGLGGMMFMRKKDKKGKR